MHLSLGEDGSLDQSYVNHPTLALRPPIIHFYGEQDRTRRKKSALHYARTYAYVASRSYDFKGLRPADFLPQSIAIYYIRSYSRRCCGVRVRVIESNFVNPSVSGLAAGGYRVTALGILLPAAVNVQVREKERKEKGKKGNEKGRSQAIGHNVRKHNVRNNKLALWD